MDSSPKGRTIEEVAGNAPSIHDRGEAIKNLGQQMIESAATLQSIADGASGQKGLAVDKLKDVVGDVYKALKLAGERYKPTGPALVAYATTLGDVQPKIRRVVEDCETQWHTYQNKQGDIMPVAYPSGTEPGDDGSAKKKAEKVHQDAVDAAQGAYETWKSSAHEFDTYYDTWEDAFDTAVNEIGKADKGGIEDGFWDNVGGAVDGFVEAALNVLNWVGLALAVACIIIGGPILLAAAAIVAVLALAGTAYLFLRGKKTVTDLVFATIAVIPFGKLGMLLPKGGGALKFLNECVGGVFTKAGRAPIVAEFQGTKSFLTTAISQGNAFQTLGRDALHALIPTVDKTATGIANVFGAGSLRNFDEVAKAMDKAPLPTAVNEVFGVWGDGVVKNIFGIPDYISNGKLHNVLFPSPTLSY